MSASEPIDLASAARVRLNDDCAVPKDMAKQDVETYIGYFQEPAFPGCAFAGSAA